MSALFADMNLAYPAVTWVGLQRMIDWIMASSAAAFLFISGGFLAWIGNAYDRDYWEQMRAFVRAQDMARIEAEREERAEKAAEDKERDRRKEENRARREAERSAKPQQEWGEA